MNEFCAKKGIKREFSVARTPQQNGVAERKNRTLIEATRTMLADSLLPIPFWAEAVNTACYGTRIGKSDEGYFLGYSTTSKAFRVYNKRTKMVEENLHIDFLEDQPKVDSKILLDKEGQHQMTEDEQVLHDELEKMIAKALDDATRQTFEEEKRNIASQKRASSDYQFLQQLRLDRGKSGDFKALHFLHTALELGSETLSSYPDGKMFQEDKYILTSQEVWSYFQSYGVLKTTVKDEDYEGAVSERPSENPTHNQPSPTHPWVQGEDQSKPQPDPFLRPSSSNLIPDSILEGSGGNHGGQSSSDRSLSGNEDGLTLKRRKPAKSEPIVHKDLAFDDLDDAMDYMEPEDAHNEGTVKDSEETRVRTDRPKGCCFFFALLASALWMLCGASLLCLLGLLYFAGLLCISFLELAYLLLRGSHCCTVAALLFAPSTTIKDTTERIKNIQLKGQSNLNFEAILNGYESPKTKVERAERGGLKQEIKRSGSGGVRDGGTVGAMEIMVAWGIEGSALIRQVVCHALRTVQGVGAPHHTPREGLRSELIVAQSRFLRWLNLRSGQGYQK
ncbi:copia protein [Tanacetum coccineum]